MKQCPNCGAELNDEAAFCTNCGQPVSVPASEEPSMPAYPEMPTYQEPAVPVYEEPAEASAEPVPEATQAPQEPTYAEQYESNTGYVPTPASAPKKKSKKLLITLIIVGVLLIGIGIGAYFLLTWYFSPEQEVLRMVQDKQYVNAQTLVAQNTGLRYNKDLENQVTERLEALKKEFNEKTADFAAATAELDAIEKLELEGLKAKIPEYRTYFTNVNQSRADFATAEKFFADGAYPEALEYYRKVIQDDPDYQLAAQKITETVTAYRTKALSDAAAYADTSAYTSAIATLEAALVVLPGDAELTSQKALYEKKHLDSIKSTALTDAGNAAGNKDYKHALSILDKYIAEYGDDSEVSVKRNEYLESYVDSVLAQVDDLQNSKDFAGAVTAIDEALQIATAHTRLQNRRTAVLAACVEYTCAEVVKLAGEKKYEDALKLLDDALKIIPNDETLLAKKTEVEDKMGKWFIEVCTPYEVYNNNNYKTNTFNMAGNSYTHGFIMGGEDYAIWNLEGKYSSLEFDLGHIDGTDMRGGTFKIYCDGSLCQVITITPESLPEHYIIDLTGVKQLKIAKDYSWTQYGFADVKIYK